MLLIIFIIFAMAIILAILSTSKTYREGDMEITERLEFIKAYANGLDSDYKLGKITEEEYQSEIAWLDERLDVIEQDIKGEGKDLAESPELVEMSKLKDDFFRYMDGIRK